MCLHYLVKLIARVLSPYITYLEVSIRLISSHQVCDLPKVLILTPLTMRYGESCRRGFTRRRLQMLKNFASASWTSGNVLHYRWRSEGMAKTTASVSCWWRRIVWTWSMTRGATVLLQLCILTLPFNRLTAYKICRDCFQYSLTLSVTCSRCEAL